MTRVVCVVVLLLVSVSLAGAHGVEYQVQAQGISARFFFLPNEPASYSAYEIFGPGDTIVYQKGRADKNGVVSFLPDRPGSWKIKMVAESAHGGHATEVDIDVKDGLLIESFSKPLVAAHAKFFVGAGLLLGVFGIWALWTARRERHRKVQ
jgi:nickel transport protein